MRFDRCQWVATGGVSPSRSCGDMGYVAFAGSRLKARAPEPLPPLSRLSFPPLSLSPSRSFWQFWGASPVLSMISMLPSPVCSVSPVSGRFPEEESPEPPTGLKATYPTSPPDYPEAGCASAASVFALLYRGTCASSLVQSHTSRSPGARHLRACPVREVVTVTWDPRPREPVEGVLWATSVLELAAA
ncbi:hypothetical protein Taro_006444 [Colocasia esculenta]|uniref:Uncharacterized protein n=1 Tax=Colocasia esculenta TaxID=4460 RepID=A0A843TSP1_COLES|nr:hypothetical protein [Colocasia esculenta]